jgi:hypothetical protein
MKFLILVLDARSISIAAVLSLLTCTAFSAPRPVSPPPNPQPTEVKIISAPPAVPTEVKIISTPPAAPAEVRIVSSPPDESARSMVRLTLWILVANAAVCIVTFVMGMRQSSDNKRSIAVSAQAAAAAQTSADAADRSAIAASESIAVTRKQERAALERELNRAAHKVIATAARIQQLASAVPVARTQLHILIGQGGLPESIKLETEEQLRERRTRAEEMSVYANDIAHDDLRSIDDMLLTAKLWRIDEYQVKLDVMREEITDQLTRYETESLTRRQHKNELQAAALNAQLARPLKNKLGE